MMISYAVARTTAFLMTCAFVLCFAIPAGRAQDDKDLSDKAVNILSRLAMKLVPAKVKDSKGNIVTIDKAKPDSVMIPLDDARRVIKVARLSAHAHICQMPELEAANYLTMMASERSHNKWSKPQLVFINRLHLFTVMWMSGSAEVERAAKKPKGPEKPKLKKIEKQIDETKSNKRDCSDTEKAEIRKRIEASIKASRANSKKS